jgi:transposase-like protein
VAEVARRYELNANVVFGWRRKCRAGRLGEQRRKSGSGLVPISVLPSSTKAEASSACASAGADVIEVQLAARTHMEVSGALTHEAPRQIIAVVRSR